MAVIVAQLVGWSLLTPEMRSSNPAISHWKILFTVNCIVRTENKLKRGRRRSISKKTNYPKKYSVRMWIVCANPMVYIIIFKVYCFCPMESRSAIVNLLLFIQQSTMKWNETKAVGTEPTKRHHSTHALVWMKLFWVVHKWWKLFAYFHSVKGRITVTRFTSDRGHGGRRLEVRGLTVSTSKVFS